MRCCLVWLAAVLLLTACKGKPSPAAGPEANPFGAAQRDERNVYLKADGPEAVVAHFARFLDIALEEHRLRRVSNRDTANIQIALSVKQKQREDRVFGEFVQADLMLKNGKEEKFKFCQRITAGRLRGDFSMPFDWKYSKHPSLKTYYMDLCGKEALEFAEALAAWDYHPAKSKAEADFVVSNVRIYRTPMTATGIHQILSIDTPGGPGNMHGPLIFEHMSYEYIRGANELDCSGAIDNFVESSRNNQDDFWPAASQAVTNMFLKSQVH